MIDPPCHALTRASSRVEKGIANSAAPGTRSSLASAPNARTSLAVQHEEMKIVQINRNYAILISKYNNTANALPLTTSRWIHFPFTGDLDTQRNISVSTT